MGQQVDVRVVVIEQDVYARHAIASYLGWDRRTRVVAQVGAIVDIPNVIETIADANRVDAVVLDTQLAGSRETLARLIDSVRGWLPAATILCLAHDVNPVLVEATATSGGRAYLVRDQVELGLAPAICIALSHRFTVTYDVAPVLSAFSSDWAKQAFILPDKKSHAYLAQRVEQALELCVVDGMPAEVAADEMGISSNTIRSYVKEGYRALEDEDDTVYPTQMSPQERAFLRLGALAEEDAERAD